MRSEEGTPGPDRQETTQERPQAHRRGLMPLQLKLRLDAFWGAGLGII